MAGFYKRNQGQLIRTLSGIGMALVLYGLCMFVYSMMVPLFPTEGQERSMSWSAVEAGNWELAEPWPTVQAQQDLNVPKEYDPGTRISALVKDEMKAFYQRDGISGRVRPEVRVRSLVDSNYARVIQVGVPSLLFIAGAIGIVLLLNKPKFADFLIATEGEMKKVSWSNRSELIGSTTVVIVTIAILGVFIALADLGITVLFRAINVH